MEDAHRQQLQDAIKDPRHPYSYAHFVRTIDAIVHRWGPNTEYEPGWTPLQWANDLKSKFTRDVWNHQEIELFIQKKIMIHLGRNDLAPNIYLKDFPSVERLRWLSATSVRYMDSARTDSWLRKTTFKDFQRWYQAETAKVRSENFNNQALERLLDANILLVGSRRASSLYQRWLTSITSAIRRHRDDCLSQGKLPEVIGALKACCRMLDAASTVGDPVLNFCLPTAAELALLFHLDPNHRGSVRHVDYQFVHYDGSNFSPEDRRLHGNSASSPPVHQSLLAYPPTAAANPTMHHSSATRDEDLDARVIILLALYSDHYATNDASYREARQRLSSLVDAERHAGTREAVQDVDGYLEDVRRGGWRFLPEAHMIPTTLPEVSNARARLNRRVQEGLGY